MCLAKKRMMDTSFNIADELIEACENILEQDPQTIEMGILALTQKEDIVLSKKMDRLKSLLNKVK